MTVLQITPGLPPVWGPYKEKVGARYFTAAHVAPSQAPYPDRLGLCLHLINYTNVGGTAAGFHRNHFVPPGDKVSGSGSLYGTCYHGIIGGAGDVVISLDETAGPNSAGTFSNQRFVHLVMMMGDWSKPDWRHEATLEALAQLCAQLCVGFGIPPVWHNVYNERDRARQLAAAKHLVNPNRAKVGIFAHRDITAAYTALMRAGLTALAEPIKNNHGDTGNYFPYERLIARIQQIIEGDTDMAQFVRIRGDLAALSVTGQIATFLEDPPTVDRLQQRGSLSRSEQVWDREVLADYFLAGPAPDEVYPLYTLIGARHFAGRIPAYTATP